MTPRDSLGAVVALLEKATPGPWTVCNRGCYSLTNNVDEADVDSPTEEALVGVERIDQLRNVETIRGQTYEPDAAAIVAAVNFLRTHAPAIEAALRDAERLKWLERNEYDLRTVREDLDEDGDEYQILWFVVDSRQTTRGHLRTISGPPVGCPLEAIDAAIAARGGVGGGS